jgi:ABC-type oligopeptide transport system substrate-binding subunit
LSLFRGGGGYNWTGWSSPRFDQELAAAAAARDPGERLARFQDAEAELLREAPIAPQSIERSGQVAGRVGQRAVEVEQDGVDGQCAHLAAQASLRNAAK